MTTIQILNQIRIAAMPMPDASAGAGAGAGASAGAGAGGVTTAAVAALLAQPDSHTPMGGTPVKSANWATEGVALCTSYFLLPALPLPLPQWDPLRSTEYCVLRSKAACDLLTSN
jgi:hypothetical protein